MSVKAKEEIRAATIVGLEAPLSHLLHPGELSKITTRYSFLDI